MIFFFFLSSAPLPNEKSFIHYFKKMLKVVLFHLVMSLRQKEKQLTPVFTLLLKTTSMSDLFDNKKLKDEYHLSIVKKKKNPQRTAIMKAKPK